jgi:hypothetical protein
MPEHNTLLESYLRQLKLPTFAQHYTAFAQDAAGTGLSCEGYLLALCEAEMAQRDAKRVEGCISQGVCKTRVFELAQARLHHPS